MVEYQDWTQIAFELAADDVQATRVISRAAMLWNQNKSRLKAMSMSEARDYGKQVL